jgi:hypothetical protein
MPAPVLVYVLHQHDMVRITTENKKGIDLCVQEEDERSNSGETCCVLVLVCFVVVRHHDEYSLEYSNIIIIKRL